MEFGDEDSLWQDDPSEFPSPGEDIISKELYRRRLHRRTRIINELRKAYLRDVVAVHRAIGELDVKTRERLYSIIGAEPCVDLTSPLKLFAPAETILDIKPCETCGGTMELTYQYSSEITRLGGELAQFRQKNQTLARDLAKTRGDLFAAQETVEQMKLSHAMEQRIFIEQIEKLKVDVTKLTAERNEHTTTVQQLRGDNNRYRVTIDQQNKLIGELNSKVQNYRVWDEDQRKLLSETDAMYDDYRNACDEIADLKFEKSGLEQKLESLRVMIEPMQASYDRFQDQLAELLNQIVSRKRPTEELRKVQNDLFAVQLQAKNQFQKFEELERRIQETPRCSGRRDEAPIPEVVGFNKWSEQHTRVKKALSRNASIRNMPQLQEDNTSSNQPEDGTSEAISLPIVTNRPPSAPKIRRKGSFR